VYPVPQGWVRGSTAGGSASLPRRPRRDQAPPFFFPWAHQVLPPAHLVRRIPLAEPAAYRPRRAGESCLAAEEGVPPSGDETCARSVQMRGDLFLTPRGNTKTHPTKDQKATSL